VTLLLILLALALSAFFSGSEIAFVTANRLKAEVRAHREGMVGRLVREFIREPSKFLTTTLVGNNVALVVYSLLMALYLEPPLTSAFVGWLGSEAPLELLVLVSQTIIASVIVLLFGEILPKSLAREPADWVIFGVAVPLKLTYWLFLPIIALAGWMSQGLARAFGVHGSSFQQFLRRDYEAVVRESRESGSLDLDEEESTILSNVFEFQATRIKDVMVPRTAIEAVPEDAPMEEIRQRFVASGYSRLLVYRDNIDNVTGVVKAHDLFEQPESLSEIVRSVPVVPEAKRAKDLLYEMLAKGSPMAVVVDEYGGTAGVVTVEDLLEELFGEIRDEYDEPDGVEELPSGVYVVEGRAEIHVLNEEYGLRLPDEEGYETVAGLLLNRLTTIPKPQQEVEVDGYRLTVLEASASRVERVQITPVAPGSEPGATPLEAPPPV
jgi:putative hemolysin